MKEYLLRIQGEMVDIEPVGECDKCSEVEELEAVMVAMIKSLRQRIDDLEGRIKEQEARPYGYIPITYPSSGTDYPRRWTITCRGL